MILWIILGSIAYLATGYVIAWFTMVGPGAGDSPATAGELVGVNLLWPLILAMLIILSPVFLFAWLNEINFWQKFYGVKP